MVSVSPLSAPEDFDAGKSIAFISGRGPPGTGDRSLVEDGTGLHPKNVGRMGMLGDG